MDKAILFALLEKFRQGACTEEEQALLHRWLDAVEQDAAVEGPLLSAAELEQVKRDMQAKIWGATGDMEAPPAAQPAEQPVIQHALQPATPTRRIFPRIARVAAIALPLAFAGYLAMKYILPGKPHRTAIAWRTIQNKDGRMQQVRLPDSSLVTLGPYSALQYPERFDGNSRPVKMLNGKAFFETATDPARPFTVDANGVRTTVLGTSFSVEAGSGLKLLRIAVATGRVKVQRDDTVYGELLPAQRFTFQRNAAPLKDSVVSADLQAWAQGQVVLRNASLEELILTINNQYGIKVTTELDIRKGNYTFRFPATMALPEVLDVIEKISYKPKIHFNMQKDQLIIY